MCKATLIEKLEVVAAKRDEAWEKYCKKHSPKSKTKFRVYQNKMEKLVNQLALATF